jgi:hypothetical protein
MKNVFATAAAFIIFTSAQLVSAGACDTNAASLDRNLNSKCSSKATRPLCESCADAEFNKVVVKIETCREKLQTTTDAYKSATCVSKPAQ